MDVASRCATYLVGGRRLQAGSAEFAQAIATAHTVGERPRCLCLVGGVQMYVARLAGVDEGYIVKRMPDTGSQHAAACPSYEPPPEASGLGQVLGSAISEDPTTGETKLKLDFSMWKIAGRSTMPTTNGETGSVASSGTRLSLRGLLHYLWDQAELTHWQPGFAGKRTWGTVRSHLLQAATNKTARGSSLRSRLYVPEVFSLERREEICTRRSTQWSSAIVSPGKPQHLMLLIGEVKEIVPARYGFKAVVKHMPDQAFAMDEQLYRRLGRCFEPELALWGASDDIHMVMMATFGVGSAGVPVIQELCLMPATRQWLPVVDGFEKQLVDRLVGENRFFVKSLHYNLGRSDPIASAVLTDCEGSAPMLFIVPAGLDEAPPGPETGDPGGAPVWNWRRSGEPMPPFPPPRNHSPRTAPLQAEHPTWPAHAVRP